MATYYDIPLSEFEAAMAEWGFLPAPPAGGERCWERAHARPGCLIRVYSSIPVRAGGDTARPVGEDAIRVVTLFTGDGPQAEKPVGPKLTRVHRVQGWRSNLHARLQEAWRQIADTPKCPACGTATARRTRRSDGSAFWGCVRYPGCRGTVPATAENAGRGEHP